MLTDRLSDPALVWNEFQGVIRGSEISLQGSNGSLDRVTYESLSFRKQAAFASHRAQLYDLFEAYMRLKRERNEYDAADRFAFHICYIMAHQIFVGHTNC